MASNSLSVYEERRRVSVTAAGGEAGNEPTSISNLLLAERQAEMSRYLLEVQRLKDHGGGGAGSVAAAATRSSSTLNDEGGVQRYHATAAKTTAQMGGISMAPGAVATDAVRAAMERHRRQRRTQQNSHNEERIGVANNHTSHITTSSSTRAKRDTPLTYPPDVGGGMSRRAVLVSSIWRLAIGVVCLYVLMAGAWYLRFKST